MLRKVADNIKKVVSPISRVFADISIIALAFAIVLVVTDVCLRRIFNSPIAGTHDFTRLAFSVVVFMPMAWCALDNGHVELDLITKRLPKTVQNILEIIMIFIGTVILGIMSWQMFAQGIILHSRNFTTGIVEIPVYPFLYLAAFASVIFTLTFFIRLLYAITTMKGEQQ